MGGFEGLVIGSQIGIGVVWMVIVVGGALNAVVEYADFKAYKSDSGLATDLMRGNALKDKALELLSA